MRTIVTDHAGHLVETTTPGAGYCVYLEVGGLGVRVESRDQTLPPAPEDAARAVREALKAGL